jgi:hypothetical protein
VLDMRMGREVGPDMERRLRQFILQHQAPTQSEQRDAA